MSRVLLVLAALSVALFVTAHGDTASSCQIKGRYADRACTPGATLTKRKADVCTPGWAHAHRHVTYAQRRRVFARYRVDYAGHSSYEFDHLIALELGGSNADANLWPEPGPSPNGKDAIENRLHRQVCAGQKTLAFAQAAMRAYAR